MLVASHAAHFINRHTQIAATSYNHCQRVETKTLFGTHIKVYNPERSRQPNNMYYIYFIDLFVYNKNNIE